MQFEKTSLEGSYVIHGKINADERGHFSRIFCKNIFREIGHDKDWVQINHSYTINKGSIRGMHFQYPPHQEIKMIKCIRGSVYDVIVDIRKDSPTFLKYFGEILTPENSKMMYVPEGFAHGFQCLSDHCELLYFHTEFHTQGAEGGIRFNDSMISINWPLELKDMSDRDKNHPLLDKTFKGL